MPWVSIQITTEVESKQQLDDVIARLNVPEDAHVLWVTHEALHRLIDENPAATP
jgi:hypothetical protein